MKRNTLVACCAALAFSGRAVAQSPVPSVLSAETRGRVIDSLTRAIERLYPAPDTGHTIAEHVRRRAAQGAYKDAADRELFARLLTQDLQATNEDTHLSVSVQGPPQGGAPAPSGHGVERIERLDGNVGYFRMSHFLGGSEAEQAIEAALRYLSTTDAMILDLRNSRGGSAQLANFLISHFTGPDTVHSLTVFDRSQNNTSQRYTLSKVPGPRRPDVPLFILIDDVTRSAAEDVPFVLHNMKRATLVGSNSAGAGRNNAGIPLGDGLVASISFTRVFDPVTHKEWERTGVTPDIRVHPDAALPAAHVLALDAIEAKTANTGRKRELALIAKAVRAAAQRRTISPATLRRYVGTYEGGQYVTVEQGGLVYQTRVAQPRVDLVPISETTFVSGSSSYSFEGSDGSLRLRITGADGRSTTYPKTSASVPPRRP